MARIPEQEIERLKKDISLERLMSAKGIELKRHGSNLLGLCPSTTIAVRAWSSRRTRTSGTAWVRARREGA